MSNPSAPPPPTTRADGARLGHLAVEASRLPREVRGIGRYVRALLPRLMTLRPQLRLTLYARARDVARVRESLGTMGLAHERVDVRPIGELGRTEADVVWYPWNIALPSPPRRAVVVTIHDIAPVVHPDPRRRRVWKNWKWRRRYAKTVHESTLLLCVSRFTRDEVHRVFGVSMERMRAVQLAADDGIGTPDAVEHDAATLERLGVRAPFVLAVGAAERRKNLGLLERAMPQAVARVPELTLALAGPRNGRLVGADLAPWKRTLGFVTAAELATLYRSAACLVIPSRYEGFGLPVLEAMRLGTPVICTRASSLPEVGGDAAAYVGPDDDAGMADAIVRVTSDAGLRARMVADGIAWSARFTWDATARGTLAAFDDAVALARAAQPAAEGALRRGTLAGALRAGLGQLGQRLGSLARGR
jgi:glycosyltransferase involved in cell wall biosynthesis